jgi:hypothetical protein
MEDIKGDNSGRLLPLVFDADTQTSEYVTQGEQEGWVKYKNIYIWTR